MSQEGWGAEGQGPWSPTKTPGSAETPAPGDKAGGGDLGPPQSLQPGSGRLSPESPAMAALGTDNVRIH